ncbi:MAG: hypothetical protein E6Q97_22925 [Desulfurellales bacterium]|nr:MAG: hypothetical protein E6Q97_22925 [Desulfurellales bacterium]
MKLPKFQFGHISIGRYKLWKHKRLKELRHQLHGYCPAIRAERLTMLPFGLAIEHSPTAWREVYSEHTKPWMQHALKLIQDMQFHFGWHLNFQ